MAKELTSCDTFAVLPDFTEDGLVIFGKNSDRPQGEVQEVVYVKGGPRNSSKLQCTYIEIDESKAPVYSVILSKPSWMWGAEMGSNEKNVCIGNEAIWTKYNEGDGDCTTKRLLGMDLVRLGLERGATAEEALDVITNLLDQYGQGGPCALSDDSLTYHNSFLIADSKEVWVLETAGKFWAAEKVDTGYRNISNCMSIRTKMDKMSDGLLENVKSLNLWDGEGDFDFAKCFSTNSGNTIGPNDRQISGQKLLEELTTEKKFNMMDMLKILRNKESGICRSCDEAFPTQGSQVSCLSGSSLSVHWFTGTPDPDKSVYKPFIFTPNVKISHHTASPTSGENVPHNLYQLHSGKNKDATVMAVLRGMEMECALEVSDFCQKYASGEASLNELDELMKDCVETEIKYYR